MLPEPLLDQAEKVIQYGFEKKLKIATAESCTGGLVAAALTSISGSSAVFERGFVTYSNEAKKEMLGVHSKVLEAHGAVSPEVALAMASGACGAARTDIALAITGIAGPAGGTAEKPVGLVYIALATPAGAEVKRFLFEGDRTEIRRQAVVKALSFLLSAVKE